MTSEDHRLRSFGHFCRDRYLRYESGGDVSGIHVRVLDANNKVVSERRSKDAADELTLMRQIEDELRPLNMPKRAEY